MKQLILILTVLIGTPSFGAHTQSGSTLPGGGNHKPLSSQSSPIATAMRSSFKLRYLQLALPGKGTPPREHVLPGKQEKMIVDVSVAPFAFFVRQIGGEWVEPVSLVPPGASPHSYEPSPKKVRQALKARIWFRIGEPFEEKLLPVMEGREIKIVDLRQGLTLIQGSCSHGHCPHGEDLHFWLSPKEAEVFSRTIADALIDMLPEHKEAMEENLARLETALQELDRQLKREIAPCRGGAIVVSHPAFGYFCRDYGITQLSVEVEGKEGSPRQLAQLIIRARDMRAQRVILQKQYSTKGAKLVAKELGIPTCTIDPYSEDYFKVMTQIARCACPR